MTHTRLSIQSIDGSTLGHVSWPEFLESAPPNLSIIVPCQLFTDKGHRVPTDLTVVFSTRCRFDPSDFADPAHRARFEAQERQSGHCRTYWGAGHVCTLPRGHDEQHVCVTPDCDQFLDPSGWGPDSVYGVSRETTGS